MQTDKHKENRDRHVEPDRLKQTDLNRQPETGMQGDRQTDRQPPGSKREKRQTDRKSNIHTERKTQTDRKLMV